MLELIHISQSRNTQTLTVKKDVSQQIIRLQDDDVTDHDAQTNEIITKTTKQATMMDFDLESHTITVYPLNDIIHAIIRRYYYPTNNININAITMADKFSKFIDSSRFAWIIVSTAIINIIFRSLATYIPNYYVIYDIFIAIGLITDICWTIEMFCLILVFDTLIIKEGLKSFDGWYRMYNMVLFFTCIIILNISTNTPSAIIAYNIFQSIESGVTVFFIINIDAFAAINRKVTFTMLIVVNIYFFIYIAVFYFSFEEDTIIIIFGRSLSVKTVALSALFNVSLFFVRQLGFKILYPNYASNISYQPKLIVNKNG